MNRWIALSLIFALVSCATTQSNAPTASSADGDALLNAADALWGQRGDKAQLLAAIEAYKGAWKADKNNLHVLVRLTRGTYFLGDAFTEDPAQKEALFQEAMNWGDKALMTNDDYASRIDDGESLPDAVAALTSAEAEALYWRSSALGKWASAKGFATIVKFKNDVINSMQKVTELAPDLYYNGPDRYWGAFYAKAPGFAGGDLDKSKAHFEASIAASPDFLGTYVLYADAYAVKAQDRALYESMLQKVIAADPAVLPDVLPEQMQEQAKAQMLLDQASDKFIE